MLSLQMPLISLDEWDSIARNNAIIFEENGGVYYNNNEKVKALKIQVAKLKTFVMSKNMDYFKKEFEVMHFRISLTIWFGTSSKFWF